MGGEGLKFLGQFIVSRFYGWNRDNNKLSQRVTSKVSQIQRGAMQLLNGQPFLLETQHISD